MNTSNIAIRVTNLSKCYQIYATPRDRLKQFAVPTLCRVFPPLRKFLAPLHEIKARSAPMFHGECPCGNAPAFLCALDVGF